MTDIVDPQTRSRMMSGIRARDTKPEMTVRRLLHAMGYRFRLHAKDLPGKPDIVFRRRRVAIFVHGCFWHRHPDPDCKLAPMPKSRVEFWTAKLEGNRARDNANIASLEAMGWQVLVIWQCQLKVTERLATALTSALEDGGLGAKKSGV